MFSYSKKKSNTGRKTAFMYSDVFDFPVGVRKGICSSAEDINLNAYGNCNNFKSFNTKYTFGIY